MEITIAIIETFTKVRELSRTIPNMGQHNPQNQKDML